MNMNHDFRLTVQQEWPVAIPLAAVESVLAAPGQKVA